MTLALPAKIYIYVDSELQITLVLVGITNIAYFFLISSQKSKIFEIKLKNGTLFV